MALHTQTLNPIDFDTSPSGALSMWAIYDSPSDFPGRIVARKFYVGVDGLYPSDEVLQTSSLDDMREKMRDRGLVKFARDANDDKKIVETWL